MTIGWFRQTVRILNLNANKKSVKRDHILAEGSFGRILLMKVSKDAIADRSFSEVFVAKRIINNKQMRFYDVELILHKYTMACIMSVYELGPRVLRCFGFDLVCVPNHTEFYM